MKTTETTTKREDFISNKQKFALKLGTRLFYSNNVQHLSLLNFSFCQKDVVFGHTQPNPERPLLLVMQYNMINQL